MANLTNNKPKDTYPRLVQIEQGRFQNGLGELITGSIVALHVSNSLQVDGNTDIAGDLVVTGSIRAREFITTTVSSSVLFQSGSTQSGDSLDDTHIFTGSINATGSVNITGSAFDVKVHRITLPDNGTSISMTDLRTSLKADVSGSDIQGNISVEDNSNGSSIVKIYGDTVLIGSYTGSIIAFGNTNTSTAFEGTNIFYGNTTMNSNRTLTLKPSIFAAITPSTGSLAVTGSSFAYYDGNNWQYMQTGSFALLADHLIATASISVNETNISTLTSATSSYALDSEVEHINSVTSSYALNSALTVATGSITVNQTRLDGIAALTASLVSTETAYNLASGSYITSASIGDYVTKDVIKALVTGSADFDAFKIAILGL